MRGSRAAVLLVLPLIACGGSAPAATHSPATGSPPATGAPPVTPAGTATPGGAGPPSLLSCTAPVPAGDGLIIGTVSGDPTIVVRDIQDPANARNLCTFAPGAISPQFVSAGTIAYETADNQILKTAAGAGGSTAVAVFTTPGSGQYAFSPDGTAMSYLDGAAWRLVDATGNHLLATLPAATSRVPVPDQDSIFLGFSPDGQYVALFQTYRVGGSGQAAPDQVRKVRDGSLVYSASGMTMATWASSPGRLYFRDASGAVKRWDPSSGVAQMLSVKWIDPRPSADGRWIAYTVRGSSGLGAIGLYSVQGNTATTVTASGRTSVRFISNDLLFYFGEKLCTGCTAPAPADIAYIYDIAGSQEVVSRLANVYDSWPHATPAGI